MDAWKLSHPFRDASLQAMPACPLRSPLVSRLVQPGIDSGRRRIRLLLAQISDERLRVGLGLSDADIAALRTAALPDMAAMGATHGAPRTEQRNAKTTEPVA